MPKDVLLSEKGFYSFRWGRIKAGDSMTQQKNMNRVFLLIFTLCVFFARGYNLYNSDNADIISVYQHMAGFGNYSGEFYIEEAIKPTSSRYFISVAISALLKAGLSIEIIMLSFYTLSFALTAIGFWKLAKRLSPRDPGAFYTVVLSIYYLTEITFRLGQAGFKFAMPLPSTFTAGICVFAYGLYFEDPSEKKWLDNKAVALFLCGFATLFQAFVGLFFGGVLILCLIYEIFSGRHHITRPGRTLMVGGILFAVPVVIAFLAGMTGAENPLTPPEIVAILAKFRQPHHNYPRSWDRRAYLEFVIAFLSTLWVLQNMKEDNKPMMISLISITGGIAFLSVLMNFISTSVRPLPLFSKLQSGRAFAPFILAVCLSWGLKAVSLIKKRQYWELFTVVGMLAAPLGGILLFPYMLLSLKKTAAAGKLRTAGLVILNLATVLALLTEPLMQPADAYFLLLAVALLFMILVIVQSLHPAQSKTSKASVWGTLAAAVIFLPLLLFKGSAFIRPDKPYSELEVLAGKFNAVAGPGLVLSDPWRSESLYFRFYSQRGTVVSFKCFPHADDGIREWAARMEKIGGVDLSKNNTKGIPFSQRSWEDLAGLAREYDAAYLLAYKSWFPDAPAEPIVQYGGWAIYRMP